MPSPTSLRVAVIGVGKIGSTFAFQLARVGQHIDNPASSKLTQRSLEWTTRETELLADIEANYF